MVLGTPPAPVTTTTDVVVCAPAPAELVMSETGVAGISPVDEATVVALSPAVVVVALVPPTTIDVLSDTLEEEDDKLNRVVEAVLDKLGTTTTVDVPAVAIDMLEFAVDTLLADVDADEDVDVITGTVDVITGTVVVDALDPPVADGAPSPPVLLGYAGIGEPMAEHTASPAVVLISMHSAPLGGSPRLSTQLPDWSMLLVQRRMISLPPPWQ